MRSPLIEPVYQLADAWRSATSASRRRVALALVGLAWVLALLVARQGTWRARVGAAIAMAASVTIAIGWRLVERRRLREPERIVRGLARGIDREHAEKALRALSLLGTDGDVRPEGTSAELARLHVTRAIAQLPSERIVERARRIADRIGVAALVAGVCVLGFAMANAWSVLEGADVLAARRGTAPIAMRWLDDVEVIARPPEYLHEGEQREVALLPLLLPYGTLVTVRGVPLHPGRHLLLSDGTAEIPLVDDGAGAVVARWPLTQTTTLRVVARFGDVALPEPEALAIESVPDTSPIVTLDGAPRQVLLVDQGEDIDVKYEASDDHGLREVHLVLRSGTREERRVLARLDGETKSASSGHILKLRDPFLKKSHAPVEVTVEAKDNDPLTGPKWGSSAAITLIPPDVGEPEARRLDALRKFRDALVDTLAWRLENGPPDDAAARKAFVIDEKARTEDDEKLLASTLSETYAGVHVPSRVRAVLLAQQEKTRKAVATEERAPTAGTHGQVVRATERFVLVADAVVRGVGLRDTRDSARQLADVADDLVLGASQAAAEPLASSTLSRDPADARSRGAVRMDAATVVLAGGGRVMLRLGSLGRDIGEIVDAYLSRVKHGRKESDLAHAELAARDLAARLHEPDPSFGSRGSVGRAGGESGGGRGTPGEEGEGTSDEVDQAEAEAEQDLDRLAQDHAGEIGKIEQALAGATSEEELEQMRQEARRHAEAVRAAVHELPTVSMGSDSWTSKGAAARELAEQMARSLEQVHPDDAAQSGRAAVGSLDEAKKILQKGSFYDDPSGEAQKRVDEARRKLDAESKWAEEQLEQVRKRAAERARKPLEQGGDEEERLADRARELGTKAGDKGSLPQRATESIEDAEKAAREAARALKQGDATKGLDRQREAQRDLEAALEQIRGDDDESSGRSPESGDGRQAGNGPVKIPGKGDHKGPEEFRRRVVRGLGQPANGSLKDAVLRYAEGLLR